MNANSEEEFQPGLVLALTSPGAGSPGALFTQTLRARLDDNPAVDILDLPRLRELSLPSRGAGLLAQADFERELAAGIVRCLRAASGSRLARTRFVLLVVAFLSEPEARKASVALLPRLNGALQRVAFPPWVEPVVVGIHILPDRWSPVEGAGHFAWLKEFSHALRRGRDQSTAGGMRGYGLAALLGRSDADVPKGGRSLNFSDHQLAAAAAEFVAASLCSRSLDWILTATRGRQDLSGLFVSFGVTAVSPPQLPESLVTHSRVLWPVPPPRERAVLRGAALRGEGPSGWDAIDLLRAPRGVDGWLLQVGLGLDPVDLVGVDAWRRCYRALSNDEQEALHGITGASRWPEPFSLRAVPAAAAEPDAVSLQL